MNNRDEMLIDEDDLASEISNIFMPQLILTLIKNGTIDKEKIDDFEYIKNIVSNNFQKVELPQMSVSIYHDFLESLKSELENDRLQSALVLSVICIEHILNHFYQFVLGYKFKLSNTEINMAISGLNMNDKIKWFYKMTIGNELDSELKGRIKLLNTMRNDIVHYKADAVHVNEKELGSYNKLSKKMNEIDGEMLLGVVNDLIEHTDRIISSFDEDIELSSRIFNVITGK